MSHSISKPTLSYLPLAVQSLQILLGSVAIALGAQIAFYLPWSPVPITLQTLAVALVAGFLGPRRALFAVAAYLVEGMVGLPVFAGGAGGIVAFLSPSRFGYLLGFLPQVFIIGSFWHSSYRSSLWGALATHLTSSVALYFCGAVLLGWWIGFGQAITLGVLPFVAEDFAKSLVAIIVLRLRSKAS